MSDAALSAVETEITPAIKDLGDGFHVARALPSAVRRSVGPFVFVDQFGPVRLAAGKGLDVRPHPHIGLATVTYLMEGEILHRDSLGNVQAIRPGAVNWMTAGSGIVHSERTPPELRDTVKSLYGLQIWVGLPRAEEERKPSFTHTPVAALPGVEGEGNLARVILGSLFGERSPVETFGETVYADVTMSGNSRLTLPPGPAERGLYLLEGIVRIDQQPFASGRLIILRPGRAIDHSADGPARLVFFGGEALDGPRHLWWNFVSSSRERIAAAKADWRNGRFGRVPGETEFIPLPE